MLRVGGEVAGYFRAGSRVWTASARAPWPVAMAATQQPDSGSVPGNKTSVSKLTLSLSAS